MDQVEVVKSKVDVVQVISEYIPLKKAGRNFKANCPLHGEKTPSFMVNPELQIWKCFGCGKGGDVFTFLREMEGMEFGEALKMLAERVGVKLTSYKPTFGEEIRDKLITINKLACDYYHFLLTKHKLGEKALKYVQDRGISEKSIEMFGLGFAPEGWDYLYKFMVQKKGYGREELEKVGLVSKTYDRFRNRLMFPLKNARGQVMGFAGRILDKSDVAKYINTSETEIYHKSQLLYGLDVARSAIKQMGYVVIVEGEIDMIASFQSGQENTVAIKGSALTEDQVEMLRRYCDTLVLALDGDVAGDAAARRGIEVALKKGMVVKMVKLMGAKDPGELAMTDTDAWKKLVKEAIPVYDFYIQSAVERFGVDVIGKKKIGKEIVPMLGDMEDEIEKAHYIKMLAKILEVGEMDVRMQLGKGQNLEVKSYNLNAKLENIEPKRTRREVVEEHVVRVGLKLSKLGDLVEVPFFRTQFWTKVLAALKEVRSIQKLPLELRARIEELMLGEGEYEKKEWERAVAELEEISLREELVNVDTDRLPRLVARLNDLTRNK
jgi:DNA primase